MISLILVMLRSRRGQALTLAVLSLLAVGAAVAAFAVNPSAGLLEVITSRGWGYFQPRTA